MEKFVQLTVTGVANGAILGLIALGFVLIFKSSGVVNFAQGELLMVGAYLSYTMIERFGFAWPIGVTLAVIAAALVGVLIEHLVLRPLIGEPVISVIMVTIGLSALLRAIIGAIYGNAPLKAPQVIPNDTVNVFGALVSADKIWAIVLALAMFVILTGFFNRSKEGIAMRAVADDQQAALSMGISVKRVWAVAWAIAAVTAAVGGILLSSIFGGVGLDIGLIGLTVFPVVILGGLDSIPGALVGGFIVGLLQAYAGGYLPAQLGAAEVLPYVVLVLILLFKPYGLFGEKRIERV